MTKKMTKSFSKDQVKQDWLVVDLSGQALGRSASTIAQLLRGKHKVTFTPHDDTGDFVVVVNAGQVQLTGRKAEQKKYYRHTGYVGGIKEIGFQDLLEKDPERVIQNAVKGMLPKNKLGKGLLKKLKVYAGAEHPHQSQDPKPHQL